GPTSFNGIVEYPLALVLACLLLPTLDEEKKTRPRPTLAFGVMGFFLGVGLILFVAALSRDDLDFNGLRGLGGRWLGIALLTTLVLGCAFAWKGRDDRAARWLDLGLPASLGVMAVGLYLGVNLIPVLEGLQRVFDRLHDALAVWVPAKAVRLLDFSPTGLF